MNVDRRHTDLILIGGGHAHVGVIRRLAMNPVPGVRITLVNSASETPYSGMLPGLISGQYQWDDCHIDLARLCRWAQVRFIRARVVAIDTDHQRFELIDAASGLARSLDYDFASLNPGATPDLSVAGAETQVLPVKPIAQFVKQFDQRILANADACHQSVVVGAGVGAVEVVLAAQQRVPKHDWSLIVGRNGLLPGAPEAVRDQVLSTLTRRGIRLLSGPVSSVQKHHLVLPDRSVGFDHCLWNTQAAAPRWLAESGLPVDAEGFVKIQGDLSIIGHPNVFAAGDAVSLNRPKAGVFAVRAGPVLADNLRRRLSGRPTLPWKPQRQWLAILNLADGRAIGWRGQRSVTGRWVFQLKDQIDRRFMAKFSTNLPSDMPDAAGDDPPLCMGCGGKAPAEALGNVDLSRDACRYEPDGPQVMTVDTLTDPLGDPWWMGRLGAMHAAGDLIAARSKAAAHLVSVAVPDNSPRLVARDLAMARRGLDTIELGENLGGHSYSAAQGQITLTLTGPATHVGSLPLRAGMRVWISRPLGSGLLFAGAMQNLVRGRFLDHWLDRAYPLEYDLQGLPDPIRLTDITGFGLAGHLHSLLEGRPIQWEDNLPEYPGIDYKARPVLADANQRLAGPLVNGLNPTQIQLVSDPQTLGGLLAIWPAEVTPEAPWQAVATLL